MRSHELLLRDLSWFIPDHPLIKILEKEFSEQELDYRVQANLEFGRDTVVLNIDDKPKPALNAQLHRHEIISMGFIKLSRVKFSDDRQRFLVYGSYIVRWNPFGFGYIFQWKNGKWKKEESSIFPVH